MATINMHMKLELKFQGKLDLRPGSHGMSPSDGQTDGRTDGQGESSIPPPTSLGAGIIRK